MSRSTLSSYRLSHSGISRQPSNSNMRSSGSSSGVGRSSFSFLGGSSATTTTKPATESSMRRYILRNTSSRTATGSTSTTSTLADHYAHSSSHSSSHTASRHRGGAGSTSSSRPVSLREHEQRGRSQREWERERERARRSSSSSSAYFRRAAAEPDEDYYSSSASSSSSSSGGVRFPSATGRSSDRYSSSGGGSGGGGGGGKLCCDKCDGDHLTEKCPYFKKARDKHRDAQKGKGPSIGGSGGNFTLRRARVVNQPGDGSCLFHSMAFGLGEPRGAASLRREIGRFIEKNGSLSIAETPLKEWVKWDSGTSVSTYASRISRSGWGGGIEMAACSRMRGVNVHVYERSSVGYKRISCFDVPGATRTVHVLYRGGVHYDALVPGR